jgi:hypothetical protein
LCKFSKPWYIQKFNFYSKRNFLLISAHPAQPRPRWPATPRRPPAPRSAHSAQAALAYLPKGVFSLTLRTPAETPSLSHVTAMWGARPLLLLLIASGHPALPSSTLECHPSRYSPRHHPPLNPLLNLAPVFNGVKAINAVVTPPRPPLSGAPRAPTKGR